MAKAVLFKLYFMTLSSLADLVNGTWCPNTLDLTACTYGEWPFIAKDVFF